MSIAKLTKNLKVSSKIAMVGSARKSYVKKLEKSLFNHNHVWSGWNYRILPRDVKILESQKEENGYFNLYFHDRKRANGSGNIEAIAKVDYWITGISQINSPEPSYTDKSELAFWKNEAKTQPKTWLRIIEVRWLERAFVPNELNDRSTSKPLNPCTLQKRFAPVEDVFSSATKVLFGEQDLSRNEIESGNESRKRSDEELIKRIKKARKRISKPDRVNVIGTRYLRNADVAEFVKRHAKGVCQLCKKEAPFKDNNGTPYLEVHHVIWLSEGGNDTIGNTVALCPNCHRQMHILDSKTDKAILQKAGLGNQEVVAS